MNALLGLLTLPLLALPLLAQQAVNVYSLEKERALGRQLAVEVLRQSKPLDDAGVDAYVKRVGGRLVAYLPETSGVYSFAVILTEATEPIPFPGGEILIPANFFLAAEDEGEFAGMLAHAIGHVALRHGTRSASRGQVGNMASIPLVFIGGWMGSHSDSRSATLSIPIGFMRFQRTYELEADTFAVELMARADYRPGGYRNYIARVQVADSGVSPLPPRETRLANLDKLAGPALVAPASSSEEFLRSQEVVREVLQQPKRRVPTFRR